MSPLDHVDDYPEIPVSLASTRALETGGWRSVRPVLTERRAPCSAGCPAGVGIPAYLDDLAAGRLSEAFAAFTARNPFPRITGRVCPHVCEQRCNLTAWAGREPISIRSIERYLGDATADLPHAAPHAPTYKRIAVVGAGPAGLAAAYYLRRSGHDVVVFDRRGHPGGLLRYGIPDYRLPTAIVEAEVARLAAFGIVFRTGVALGADVGLEQLKEQYAAVFVATGASRERQMGIPGDSLLEPGLAFLEAAKRGDARLHGRRCAVIGGGNTAIDVARTLRALGGDVTVMYRRTAEEMPAIDEEYQRAVADRVVFEWLTLPRSVRKRGPELELTVETMQLGEPDETGRRRPLPTGAMRQRRFDVVYSAIGEVADTTHLPARMRDATGWLLLEEDGATADPLVFAGGDLATGPATVVEAIVAGRRAARAIDLQLGFADRWRVEEDLLMVTPDEVNPATLPRRDRIGEPSSGSTLLQTEETVTISEAEALHEMARCASCGHCNACGTCFVFCPDGAIVWEEGPVIDHDYCKGCGICVTECPGHAFILINEREPAHA